MQNFWDPDKLLCSGANYYITISRGTGKLFATLKKIIEHYIATGEQTTFRVRSDTDIMPSAKDIFEQFNGYISTLTNDKFNGVVYKNGCYYLAKFKNNKFDNVDNVPFFRFIIG